jgi:hypothetical protein
MTAKDWLDSSCNWQERALATPPTTDTVPPAAERAEGVALADKTTGAGAGTTAAAAAGCSSTPSRPHPATTRAGRTIDGTTSAATESRRRTPRTRAVRAAPGRGRGDVEYMRALSLLGRHCCAAAGEFFWPRRLSNPPCQTQPGLLTMIVRAIAENGFKVLCELPKSSVPARARAPSPLTSTPRPLVAVSSSSVNGNPGC